jgi:hypothetical protein
MASFRDLTGQTSEDCRLLSVGATISNLALSMFMWIDQIGLLLSPYVGSHSFLRMPEEGGGIEEIFRRFNRSAIWTPHTRALSRKGQAQGQYVVVSMRLRKRDRRNV